LSPNSGTLILRSDASIAIGIGHVMRCLALAQAWQDTGGKAVFAMAEISPSVRERLLAEGVEVISLAAQPGSREDARCAAKLACEREASWVVVDGYHFGAEYQAELKAAGLRVLFVDDNGHASHYAADLVLNQNAHAKESSYPSREPYTRLLLGTRYVLLRREFELWREWAREVPAVGRKILITMGGSDPDNITARAIEALAHVRVEALEARVVVGGSNPHLGLLEEAVARSGRAVRVHRNTNEMPELMAWADVALIAAGGTLWELLFMCCPVLSYARNPVQGRIIADLGREGVVRDLGHPQDFDSAYLGTAITELAQSPACRSRMAALGRERIDGRGAGRTCELLIDQKVRHSTQ
jgi:UDP-2,4-diacetamido-2,4,6-trideoxy-beta-L-altropyranose hydrolase